ncbi:hypothetical protein H257_07760 [Aphanomyces astaci]|uniref:AB hydrolase-1 domain-containing protein n=2 Tax=Aphanomyces astaci TaxID=112090 RepID=W4GI51_APHAT|nr:hypothetical protein H257_07760 [Aphanomyces astaci]ETV78976.1 hypothetical protein H257_07760 [Aphanomyces astaci]|eukprot:XP_009831695.1 hypothetical protein H257_07760 [Aphanomyces astaci]
MPASVEGSKKALIMVEGGPGRSSVSLELFMDKLHRELSGEFHIFTVDHRGTGRSGRLDCPAAQALSLGSHYIYDISSQEVSNCLKDIHHQFGTNAAAAYSITNAAKDLAMLVETEMADYDVYLYGMSYGTLVVERLMHFSPPQVKGYILDSICADHYEPQGTGNNQVYSNWDDDVKHVSQHFLDLCQKDTAVCGKLLGENATTTLFNLYDTLDANASACSAIFYDTLENKPSVFLRLFFFKLLGRYDRRKFIPTFAARLERCNAQDKDVMTAILTKNDPRENSVVLQSNLLQDTIVYSELWQVPTPSMEDIKQQFLASPMAVNDPDKVGSYCVFTGSNSSECAPWVDMNVPPWTYTPDKYFNKTAAIPIGVSVLGLTGNLDPLTPSKHARRHFNNMKGDNKKLVEFPVAVHGVIGNTPLSDNHTDPHCGLLVVADFLLANGALDAINLNCMDKVQPLNFDIPDALALELFGLDGGAMDGKLHTPAQGAKDYNFTVVGLGLNALLKHSKAKATRGKYAVYEDACTGNAS